ncbi:MAG: BtrH N-terminal domain-containing protein [Chloroflexi bacterium]|nr:BtrH N-terminal domain-containing protein [Chloroflexota bacterium]
MPKLDDYDQFDGRHWETGGIRNFYAYRGVKAPHTNEPYSEALLLGVSGGIVMGYFMFAYEGYDPQARILTRNTFDPWDTLLSRLGVAQNIQHTSSPKKGLTNLTDTLEEGLPAIVWADMFSLPHNVTPDYGDMWAMLPIVVYGHEEDTVWMADRARVPLTAAPEALAAARERVKKTKLRVATLGPPDPDKLATAVSHGIWDCIKLFTEAPPKGSKNNFGFAAFQSWADLLVKPKARRSWAKEFPPGSKMVAGLTSAFHDINIFGKQGYAERDTYADFLEESSLILDKPALQEIALQFRRSAQAWEALSQALLPEDVTLFKETRKLMLEQQRLFLEQGNASMEERRRINGRLNDLKAEATDDFPLNEGEVQTMRENIQTRILEIHDIEREAILALQAAMS